MVPQLIGQFDVTTSIEKGRSSEVRSATTQTYL